MSNIEFKNISKSFESVSIFKDISLEIPKDKITCIVGPSGCGKSTILNMLSGLESLDEGRILGLEDSRVSYMFQSPKLLPWKTVRENLEFVLEGKISKERLKDHIKKWLSEVRLDEYENFYPSQLSGGMKQRVSIARAFSFPSNLLLMDESFKGLDEPLVIDMIDLVYRLWKEEKNTIVFVTHSIREALLLGHKIIVLSQKPTTVLDNIDVNLCHNDRRIGCQRSARLERHIYRLLKK